MAEDTTRKIYDLSNFTILLVEDFEFMRQLTTNMLKEFGVGGVAVANSGNDAKHMLNVTAHSSAPQTIDIVLTDWMMPDGSGHELIQYIRNHKSDKIKFIPVIMISAFTSENTILTARDSGVNEAMVKPVSGEKLASRILNVIDHPRPFIKAPDFFGPDRRRRTIKFSGEDRRKIDAEQIKVNYE